MTSPLPDADDPTRDRRRITELEIRLTHQERAIEDLSDMVAAQGRMIDHLTARLRLLTDRLREAESFRPSPADERPPPHY